jgi:F-type H+-transporting ATPase subunit alpha
MPVDLQVVSVWAVSNGRLDDVPVEDVNRFESGLHDYMQSRHAALLVSLKTSKLSDEMKTELAAGVDAFKAGFQVTVSDAEAPAENEGWDAMSAGNE